MGFGKRLFADGTILAAFKARESYVTQIGVIVANYELAQAQSQPEVDEYSRRV